MELKTNSPNAEFLLIQFCNGCDKYDSFIRMVVYSCAA